METKYDYTEAVRHDIMWHLKDNYTSKELASTLAYDREKFEEQLYDDLFTSDCVTGNGSGSYTFCTWTAEEYLAHNLSLLEEALRAFGDDVGAFLRKGAEACDVTIRCYLLGRVLSEILDELEKELVEEIEAAANHEEE